MGCKATKAKGREDAKDGGQLPASGSTLTTGSDLAAQGRTREVVLKTDAEQAAQEYQQIVKAKQDAEAARSKRKRVDDFDPIRPLDSFNITHRALLGRCWDQRQTELPSLILVQKVASMAAAEMTALQGNHGNGGGAYALAAKDFSTAAAVAQDNPAGSPLNHSLNGDGGMDGPGSPLVPGIGRGMARRSHWFTLLSAARKSSEVGGSGGPNPALAGLPEPLCNARAFSDITLEQITSLNGEQREILFNTLAAPRFDGIKEAYAFRLSEQLDSSEDTKFLRSRNLKPAKGLTVDRWNRVDFFHPNFNTLVRAAYATKGKSTATVTTTAAASPLMAGQRAGNASGLGSFNGSGLTNSFDQHIISERENSSFNTNPVASPLGPSTHHHFPGVCALESGPLTEEMKVRQPFPTESLLGMAMGIPSQRIAQLAGIPQLLQQQQNLLSPDAVSVDESSSGSSTSGGGTQPLVALCISSFSVGIDPFRWKEHRYTRRPIDVDSSKPSTRRTYGEGIVTDVMYGGVIVVECSSPESARELERMLKGLQWSEARSVRAIVADVRKVFKTLREERLARRNSTSSSPNGSPFHVACATNLGIPEEEDDRYRMWLRVGGRPMRDNVEFKEITVFLESNNGGMTSNGTSRTASPVVPRRGSFPDAAAADNNTTFSRVASAWVDLPTIASVLRTWGLHLLGNPEYSQPISLYLQRYAGVGLALQHKTLSSFRNGAEMSSEEEDESASPNEVDGGGFYEEDEGYHTAIKDGGGVVGTSRSKHPISKFNRFYTSARSSSLQLSDQGQGHKAQRNGGVGGPRLGGVLSRATTASSASSLHPPPRGLSAQTLPGVGHAHQLSASSSRSLSLDSSSSSSSSSEAAAPPGDASTVLSRESTGVFHDRSCLASFAGPGAAAAGGRCAKRQGPPGHHHHHHHQRAKAATAAKPLRNPVRQGLAKKPPLPSKAKTSPTAATPSGSSTAATVTAATSTPTSAAAVAAIKKSGKDIGTPGSPKGPLHNASIISTASTQIMVGNGSINRSIVLSPTMARLRASSGSPSHGVNSPARRTDLEQVWYMADLELKAQQVELEETRQAKLEAEKRLNARQKDLQTLHRAFLPQSTESELDLTFLYLKTAIYDSDELPDNRLYLDQPDWLPLLMAVWTNPANLVRSVSISASLTWRDLPKLGILGSLLYHDHAGSSLHALEINAEYLFGAPLPVAGGVASAAPAAAPSPVVLDFRSSLSLLATGGASGAGPVSSSSTPPFFISPAQARDLLLTLLCAVGDNNVHDGFVFTLRGFPAGADKSSGGGGGGLGGLLPFTSKRGNDVGGEGLLLQQGSLNLEGFAVKSGSTPELSFDRNPTVYEVAAESSAGPLTRREDSRSFYGSPEPREWAAVEEDGVPLHVHGKLKRKWIKEATKVEVLPFCNILYHTCSGLQNNEYYVGHYHHPYNEVHHHRDYFLTGARRQKLTALEAAEAAWCAERRRQGHAVAGRVKVATTAKMAASMYNVFGLLSREEEESIFKEEAALLYGHAGTIWEVLRKSVKHYNHDVAVAKAKRRETAGMGTKSGGKAPPCLPRIILART